MQLPLRVAARALCVSERTVLRWIESAGLPAHRIDGLYHFNKAELLEWATARHMDIEADALCDADELPSTDSLAEALERGGVYLEIPGDSPAELFKNGVERLPLPAGTDRAFLVSMLVAREREGSTAVGDGIAIPHVRHPVILDCDRPLLAVLYPMTPVDFGAPDGQPVKVVFVLVTPNQRVHLDCLSRLARLLHAPAFQKALRRRAALTEVVAAAKTAEGNL